MFFTTAESEFRPGVLNGEKQARGSYWHAVEVKPGFPWFIVAIEQLTPAQSGTTDGDVESIRTVLVTTIFGVMELLWKDDERSRVSSVQIVLPPLDSGTAEWQVHRLASVWSMRLRPQDDHDLREIEVFKAVDGVLIPPFSLDEFDFTAGPLVHLIDLPT
jgi:hypothetical protein